MQILPAKQGIYGENPKWSNLVPQRGIMAQLEVAFCQTTTSNARSWQALLLSAFVVVDAASIRPWWIDPSPHHYFLYLHLDLHLDVYS